MTTTDPALDLAPATSPVVRPERLLARATKRRALPGMGMVAESAARRLLTRSTSGSLTIVDETGESDASVVRYGPGGSIDAELHVHDPRAWQAILSEGSIGLGRGYIQRWWTSDDPTAVVRFLAANIEPLDEFRNRLHHRTSWLTDPVRSLLPRRNQADNKEDIASHYDVGNEFFTLFLDDTMTYSSGVFLDPADSLTRASVAKYDRLIDKLGLDDRHHLLEIGTGWGGMILRAAERTDASITTTTISGEQLAEAGKRVANAGIADRVTLLDRDWRELTGQFDRIVSIEMIEAVDWRDYDRFFSTIESCLRPDGLVGLQGICVPDRRAGRTKNTEDFIRRFVFPGGFLPSIGAVVDSVSRSTQLQILDVEDLTAHYAETLRRWRDRFDANLDQIRELGFDDRFIRLWRFYLSYCEAGFEERHTTVNQFVLAGPQWRPDGLALRPH